MRIISGTFRGKSLSLPKSLRARPTTDFAREGLFNIIENNFSISDISVLDLFSGTGSVSLEFASRGCTQIQLVEIDRIHYTCILKHIREMDLGFIKAMRADVFKCIRNLPGRQYDLIFADPPFDLKDSRNLPDVIFEYRLLKNNGWFILEHNKNLDFSAHPHFKEQRKYGAVLFSFFE